MISGSLISVSSNAVTDSGASSYGIYSIFTQEIGTYSENEFPSIISLSYTLVMLEAFVHSRNIRAAANLW